jgi:two-component system, NarL family, invasion response regulator UvrY
MLKTPEQVSSSPDLLTHSDALIADSNRVNGEAIAWCLGAYGVFRKVSSVGSGAELLQQIRSVRPRIVLLSETLIVATARELFSELAVRMGETRVVVFGDALTDRQLDLVVNNRITGVLSRQDSMRTINDQLVQVAAGQPVLSELLTSRIHLSSDGQFRCAASDQLKKLSDRQWDVLLKIAEGGRVAEVAQALSISEKAVEAHKYRIMRLIGATDRVDLCRWAIREGLIDP